MRRRTAADSEVAGISVGASEDMDLGPHERLQTDLLWINFANTHRSNYIRARTVGEPGLARQAALAVAAEASISNTFRDEWASLRSRTSLVTAEFVDEVDSAFG